MTGPAEDAYSLAVAEVESAPDRETAARLYRDVLFPLALARVARRGGEADLLVLTVGEQPWSVALSLVATPARRVLAIHTDRSRSSVVRAIELVPEPRPEVYFRSVAKADSTAVYTAIGDALAELGAPPERVAVDFTSGTKAMTAGASTFAGFRRLRQVYIASERLNGAAGALFGHEEVHRVDHPLVTLGEPDRLAAEQAFDSGDFTLAERLFADLGEARVPGFHFDARARLSRAYRSWEALGFAEAAEALEDVATRLQRAHRRHVARDPLVDLADRLRRQASHCRDLTEATRGAPFRGATPPIQADHANALLRWLLAGVRRATPRRLDLAALLAYRALELALQRRLAVHDLNPSAFRPPDPEALLSRYNKVDDTRPPLTRLPDRLGLAQSWAVLTALDDAALRAVGVPRRRLFGVVEARNHSVLAHGFHTVSIETQEQLLAVVRVVAGSVTEADGHVLPDPDDGFDFVHLGR